MDEQTQDKYLPPNAQANQGAVPASYAPNPVIVTPPPRQYKFDDAISDEEKRHRVSVIIVNIILAPFFFLLATSLIVYSCGLFLIAPVVAWLFSEVQVRRIQALGVTVSPAQFPEVYRATEQVCARFGIPNRFKVVVVQSGEMNAFALKVASNRLVILYSSAVESIIDSPDEIAALMGHEICHHVRDHGWTRFFLLYRPAPFKAARELTCDNAGLLAAGNAYAMTQVLKKLSVGRDLSRRINDHALEEEARQINSGFTGWLVRRYLSHPPVGARIQNLREFAARAGF